MASITDKLVRATDSSSARPIIATLTGGGKGIGAASCTISAATNWTTTTKVHIAIYTVTAAGIKDPTTQTDWAATLAGTTLSNLTLTGGIDRAYSAGAYCEITFTSGWAKDMYDWGIAQHKQTGAHAAVTTDSITNAGNYNQTGGTFTVPNATIKPSYLATGAQAAYVAAAQTTTSTTYADLATTTDSVTVTIGANGLAMVFISCGVIANTAAAALSYVSFAVSGANTQAASDIFAISNQSFANNGQLGLGAPFLLTGLTAGSTTFKMKYRVNGSTGTYQDRRIAVIPL